ncbi:RDD family protein [Chitinophaga lutea]
MKYTDESPHLLDERDELMFPHARIASRATNFLIDGFFCFLIAWGINALYVRWLRPQLPDPSLFDHSLWMYVFLATLYSAYYLFLESATGGRTIGKYFTGTCALRHNGSPLGFKDAVRRSIARLFPLTPLLPLVNGIFLHDRATSTCVVALEKDLTK